jgi:hypothetical protein
MQRKQDFLPARGRSMACHLQLFVELPLLFVATAIVGKSGTLQRLVQDLTLWSAIDSPN